MKIDAMLARSVLVLAMLLTAAPSVASTSGPAAPPEETLLARNPDFTFPEAMRTFDGKRLPRRAYDLALVRSDDGLLLQVTDRETRRGARFSPLAIAEVVGQEVDGSGETSVRLLAEEGHDLLMFQSENLTVAFSLAELRRRL